MRLNRFEVLLRHIHFNHNANIDRSDRLYKIRPLLNSLNENFKKQRGLDEHLSIDGKHYAKQYIKGKPIRFKNWALLCSSNGYMISFEIYTGKSDAEKVFGLDGDVVMSLLHKSEVPSNQGYKIFVNNYFTSLSLLNHLSENKICATATVRDIRTEKCPFPESTSWKSKPRGSHSFVSCDNVTFVQWKDNKAVTLGTNFESNDIVTTSRWCKETKTKKQIPQPKIIAGYNKHMGGFDKMDGLIAL
ncbi:piggyBac transposable element-derived protein 3-like [Anthonomus grandis grandis]|uniref:piggyBac transposable element-derived protein 3-like n=1 Tax=Anthonomus grandis grandis TaxID=2921223 RepID=UPI0021652BA2|nr:piggyBac transposable element-derived protein 3-like [Anthonomus grandis grandis]